MADLPPDLSAALSRLDQEFYIPKEKLKEIVKRFIEELEEGLEHGEPIVRSNSLPPSTLPL